MSVRGGSEKYHTLLYMYTLNFTYATCTEHKLDRGFTHIFCYTDSHYVQKANEPIKQGERCRYKISVYTRVAYQTTRFSNAI